MAFRHWIIGMKYPPQPRSAPPRPPARPPHHVMWLPSSREPPNMSSLEPSSTEAWQRPIALQEGGEEGGAQRWYREV